MERKKKSDSQEVPSNNAPLLWDIAIKEAKEKRTKADHEIETNKNLLICGGLGSGKTTLFLNFLDRGNEITKPTIALDFAFSRKGKPNSSYLKDVGNMWELGEGLFLIDLIDVVITKDTVFDSCVIVTVDLSKLSEVWITLETIMERLRARVNECFKKAVQENSVLKEKLTLFRKRIGDNPDRKVIEIIDIPVAIVATKYDQFEKMLEPEKRKLVCRSLRYVAHHYGAMLLFTATINDSTINKFKALVNHFLFDGVINTKQIQVDHMKPIFVPFGADTVELIGPPQLTMAQLNDAKNEDVKTLLDKWKLAFCKSFAQEETKKDPSLLIDYGNEKDYAEPLIDTLKDQKMRELETVRESMKKRRSQEKDAVNIQIIS